MLIARKNSWLVCHVARVLLMLVADCHIVELSPPLSLSPFFGNFVKVSKLTIRPYIMTSLALDNVHAYISGRIHGQSAEWQYMGVIK